MLTISCPACGHLHPQGIGVSICGCNDCFILSMDYDILGEDARKRIAELREMEADPQ